MAAEVVVNSAKQIFEMFANDHGILEIAIRGKNGKMIQMPKLILQNLTNSESTQQITNKVANVFSSANPIMGGLNLAGNGVNTVIGMKSLKMLGEITKLSKFNLILTGVNLCATCIGFKIMKDELTVMSNKINEVLIAVKEVIESNINFELKKVLAEHSNMLDCRRLLEPYSAEKMRELADAEYRVLDMLISAFFKNSTNDEETLIFSIYSLASMLAATIMYFDETYYYTKKEKLSDSEKWHPSHDDWVSVFDKITSDEFVAKIQDYGMFSLDLNTDENDLFYKGLHNQVKSLTTAIKDNQTLIVAFDNEADYKKYFELMNQDIRETVTQLFADAGIPMDDDEVAKAVNDAFEKVAVA